MNATRSPELHDNCRQDLRARLIRERGRHTATGSMVRQATRRGPALLLAVSATACGASTPPRTEADAQGDVTTSTHSPLAPGHTARKIDTADPAALPVALTPRPPSQGRKVRYRFVRVNVPLRADPAQLQAALDECRGAVATRHAGGQLVSQHDYCSNRWVLRLRVGQIVHFTGQVTGTFRLREPSYGAAAPARLPT